MIGEIVEIFIIRSDRMFVPSGFQTDSRIVAGRVVYVRYWRIAV